MDSSSVAPPSAQKNAPLILLTLCFAPSPPRPQAHAFRLLKDRVYYVSESLLKSAPNLPADTILSLGTCMGKFTKSKKFKLHITSLDVLNRYALYKVWVKVRPPSRFLSLS